MKIFIVSQENLAAVKDYLRISTRLGKPKDTFFSQKLNEYVSLSGTEDEKLINELGKEITEEMDSGESE